MKKKNTVGISEFKAKALGLLDQTARKGREYVVLKKGIPIARVIPYKKRTETRGGSLKGLAETKSDIVSVDFSEDWDLA